MTSHYCTSWFLFFNQTLDFFYCLAAKWRPFSQRQKQMKTMFLYYFFLICLFKLQELCIFNKKKITSYISAIQEAKWKNLWCNQCTFCCTLNFYIRNYTTKNLLVFQSAFLYLTTMHSLAEWLADESYEISHFDILWEL